jgi:hypothetical protein
MMSNEFMTAAANRLATVDVDGPRTRLQEIGVSRDRLAAAIGDAEMKRDKITAAISDRRREGGPDGGRAAEALLAGDDVLAANETVEVLQERRQVVQAGIGELNERLAEVDREAGAVRSDLGSALAEAAAPLGLDLVKRAEAAVAEIAAVYADAEALERSVSDGSALRLRASLSDPLARLGWKGRLAKTGALHPSADLLNLLEQHRQAIGLTGRTIPAQIPFPDPSVAEAMGVASIANR